MALVPSDRQLRDLHVACWDHLIRARHDRKSEFRWMNVATIDMQSNPQIRTVVLRSVNARDHTLAFHTDRRSAKWQELNGNTSVALHFHARRAAVQIRMSGHVLVAGEDERLKTWQHLHDGVRKTYGQKLAPGSVVSEPEENHDCAIMNEAQAYANFAVINVTIHKIDWLELGLDRNRRALFTYGEHGALYARWIAP